MKKLEDTHDNVDLKWFDLFVQADGFDWIFMDFSHHIIIIS